MDKIIYFKDFFESIPDYRKIFLFLFSIENDGDLLGECGYLKMILIVCIKSVKSILIQQNEDYLYFI